MLECLCQEKSSICRPRRGAHPELSFGLVIRYGRRQACNLLDARVVASTSENSNNNNNNNVLILLLLSFLAVALWRSIWFVHLRITITIIIHDYYFCYSDMNYLCRFYAGVGKVVDIKE